LLEELLAHNIALASRLAQELESRTPNSEKWEATCPRRYTCRTEILSVFYNLL
jgi:hypothetical protein